MSNRNVKSEGQGEAKERKDRIARAFSGQAMAYDHAAEVQWRVSQVLMRHIEETVPAAPARVLEIGCGTGFLSARLVDAFPRASFLLTDIAPSMLERCRMRLGERHHYRQLDGERPEALLGGPEGSGAAPLFDLIASNLTVQWFVNLQDGLARLRRLLAPGGRMIFTTLGRQTFHEWRTAHARLALPCGTPNYPGLDDFPWPDGGRHVLSQETIVQAYADGQEFVRTLKALGASEPAPGHRPLSAGAFRRLLSGLEGGFAVTYDVLIGVLAA